MSIALTFQDAVLRLHEYWRGQGCLIWQPTNTEVGAGTMNPATFLRVLGPEAWRVAYIEPSVRPDDSRYGENPNRVQMHTQFQVVLKPDPGNPQDLYLGSLKALGIDARKHDVRFVEDNWESPALGAWGLGWEVWLDGLEITQFTYFQQAGGFQIDPVAIEITYGLDRILMALQGVDHFKKLLYAPGITYGEVLGENEYEMSVYNLDVADVSKVRQLFELYEAEARVLLERELPLPAYNYVLKTSHAFNLLDARGAVGVTERARFFAKMRDLARNVAKQWLELREKAGYPLGVVQRPTPRDSATALPSPTEGRPRTFLLEIGTEEMPPDDVASAAAQLRQLVSAALEELRLNYRDVEVQTSARRLTVLVYDVAAHQRSEVKYVRGPQARNAFDDSGLPTKAALGFARSNGVTVADLERRTVEDGEYVFAAVKKPERSAVEALSHALPEIISRITFVRSMRWNLSNVAFSRPIRWLVALWGEQVIPFVYADVDSGRMTRGLRNTDRSEAEIARAEDYSAEIHRVGIVLDETERARQIQSGADALAVEVGGRIRFGDGSLLREVVQLVEAPFPIRGQFEASFLSLPPEVLTTVMRSHQRYFPVEGEGDELLPYFVTIANGPVDPGLVRAGNEAVLRARFSDAEFYWRHDTARRIEEFLPALTAMTFQDRLGSMLDKTERLEAMVAPLANLLQLATRDREAAARAAHLAKADLASQIVTEFTELAGIMGERYALLSGEGPDVARTILEHTLPRSAGDVLPQSPAGILLALADRLDSLVGLFAVGLAPKASADPFAQRRAALGVVLILVGRDVRVSLRGLISDVAKCAPVPALNDVQDQVFHFIVRRYESWVLEDSYRPDLVQAVLSARGDDLALAHESLESLSAVAEGEHFKRFVTSYSRPARLLRDREIAAAVSPEAFETDEEKELWRATAAARARLGTASRVTDLLDAFDAELLSAIDRFFEKVFVMVEDQRVRENRLALLREVAGLADGIIDPTKIAGF